MTVVVDMLADWWVHPATVERFAGAGAFGDNYDEPQDVVGFVDDSSRLVRGPAGEQVVSGATLYLPATVADVPAKSRVTLGGPFAGRPPAVVIVMRRHDAGPRATPNHLELVLDHSSPDRR